LQHRGGDNGRATNSRGGSHTRVGQLTVIRIPGLHATF
jgi:hypothetical protein